MDNIAIANETLDGALMANNFGDAISHVFYEELSQKKLNKVTFWSPESSYLTVGSVLQRSKKNHTVMGSGFISKEEVLPEKPHKILSVRGPKTKEKLLSMGVADCPEVYGDPLIILPLIYDEEVEIEYDIGIIPHYIDAGIHATEWRAECPHCSAPITLEREHMPVKCSSCKHEFSNWKMPPSSVDILKGRLKNYKINTIDIVTGENYKNFIREIKKCEYIISSSLHGVMMGLVYGRNTIFTEFSQNVAGNKFKFYDFFESLNIDYKDVGFDNDELFNNIIQVKNKDLKRVGNDIINVCPFVDSGRKGLLTENWDKYVDKNFDDRTWAPADPDSSYFTAIIWNTSSHLKERILEDIPNVQQITEIKIEKNELAEFIHEVYKLDKRCAHDIVLPPKIKRLSEHEGSHFIVKFGIENPDFNKDGVCLQSISLKEAIRHKYQPEIENYIRDIIIHVADNHGHAKHIWHNLVTELNYVGIIKEILDKTENYALLRGYDDLHKKAPDLSKGEDIDILLENENNIANICGGHNIININNDRVVKFDRRFIGDGYYDESWQRNMLNNKLTDDIFNTLNDEDRYYATLYHSLIHKGAIHEKYNQLYASLEKKLEIKIKNNSVIDKYYHLLRYMIKNGYNFTRALDQGVGFFKDKYQLNLFILRKAAMKEFVIEHVLAEIEKRGYKIIDTILVSINNNEKFCKDFYNNYDEFKKEILRDNDNQCLTIVTDLPRGSQPNIFKNEIRAQYVDFYPNPGGTPGNIIHASDSAEDCEAELALLLNENKTNFKNIGTYYDTKDE